MFGLPFLKKCWWIICFGGTSWSAKHIYIILHTCLFLGEGATAEVPSSFVILSLCTLVVLVILLANCVSCCKDPEIDFKVRPEVTNVCTSDNSQLHPDIQNT